MKFSALLIIILSSFALMACSPTAPDSPDPAGYGQTIKPDHNVPADHQTDYGQTPAPDHNVPVEHR